MCVPSCTDMVLQSRQFADLQIFQPLPFVQVCPLYLVPGLGIVRVQPFPNSLPRASSKANKLAALLVVQQGAAGYTSLREVVGESLPQGFSAGTVSAKPVLFFRLESDLSLLKGRASVSGRFSAR